MEIFDIIIVFTFASGQLNAFLLNNKKILLTLNICMVGYKM